MTSNLETLFTPDQLAKRLTITLRTLEKWRMMGEGPAFLKMGAGRKARVRYRASDIEVWENSCPRIEPMAPGVDEAFRKHAVGE